MRPGLGRDQGGFTGSAEISFHLLGLCLFFAIVFTFFPVAENVLSKVLRGALLDGSVWCSRREEAAAGTQSGTVWYQQLCCFRLNSSGQSLLVRSLEMREGSALGHCLLVQLVFYLLNV